MADMEKVIKGLKCCAKWMKENDVDACNSCPYHSCDDNDCIAMVNIEAITLLKEQEPRTAHWFISEYEYFTCSSCGESYYTDADSTEEARQRLANGQYYKFCPYCGAKMTNKR